MSRVFEYSGTALVAVRGSVSLALSAASVRPKYDRYAYLILAPTGDGLNSSLVGRRTGRECCLRVTL